MDGLDAERGPKRTIDPILVAEFLELRLCPRIESGIGNRLVSCLGAGGRAGGCILHLQVRQTRVPTNSGNQFVALYTRQ